MKSQQRFMLALVFSAAVLIGWNYFFPPVKPPQNTNANQQAAQASPQASTQASRQAVAQPSASATATPATAQAAASPTPAPETVPQRKIHVVTPLYDVTFDTRGAVATSWIVTRNKNTGREIHAASSTKDNPKPLELISPPT